MKAMNFEQTFVALNYEKEVMGNCCYDEFLSCIRFEGDTMNVCGYLVDEVTEKRINNIIEVIESQSEIGCSCNRANEVLKMFAILLIEDGFSMDSDFSFEGAVNTLCAKYHKDEDFIRQFKDAGKYVVSHAYSN